MRRTLAYLVIAGFLPMPCLGQGQKSVRIPKPGKTSWNKIRYVGGTMAPTTATYDWNVTLTITYQPDAIDIVIAPGKLFQKQQTIHIAASQVVSLSGGPAAWRKVEEVNGAQLPPRPPKLFGLLHNEVYMGIVWQTGDGKHAAILLDSYYSPYILYYLQSLTGKMFENMP